MHLALNDLNPQVMITKSCLKTIYLMNINLKFIILFNHMLGTLIQSLKLLLEFFSCEEDVKKLEFAYNFMEYGSYNHNRYTSLVYSYYTCDYMLYIVSVVDFTLQIYSNSIKRIIIQLIKAQIHYGGNFYSIFVHVPKNGKIAISNRTKRGVSLFLSLLLNLPPSTFILCDPFLACDLLVVGLARSKSSHPPKLGASRLPLSTEPLFSTTHDCIPAFLVLVFWFSSGSSSTRLSFTFRRFLFILHLRFGLLSVRPHNFSNASASAD